MTQRRIKVFLYCFSFHCLWKEILPQQRIRHFKILQSIYFAYDVSIFSSYSNRIYDVGIIESRMYAYNVGIINSYSNRV